MRVAVVGAGVGGLTAAYRLGQRGHDVDVYERWPGFGGQAATLEVGDGLRLERYYHHVFRSDSYLRALFDEVGLPDELEWRPSSIGMLVGGRLYPFTSPLDLLRYRPLPPLARLRMGLAVVRLQRGPADLEPFESVTARHWIERTMGRAAYERVWAPILRGKFGARAEEISMAWLWSKLRLRRELRGEEVGRELLGYPRSSWESLWARLVERIEEHGNRVLIDRPVAWLSGDGDGFLVHAAAPGSFRRGEDPRAWQRDGDAQRYDAVIATVASDVFAAMLAPELGARLDPLFRTRLEGSEYFATVCMLLEVDRRLTDFYWTNVVDDDLPFVGIVEHTNFVEPERYRGRRFVYIANYVARDDPMLELDPDALLERYEPGLRRARPDFSRDWILQRWLFRDSAAQPIVTVGYRERIPPIATGVPRLLLINTTQIYPEDRGTNYGVKLAEEAVGLLTATAAR